ncbi:MAG: hypothetical protein ACFFDW_05915 [Candidatus Thorarchaeota archaeon]
MSSSKIDEIQPPFFIKEGETLQLHAIKFENGIFIGISPKEKLRLGTVALSVPFDSHLGTRKTTDSPSATLDRKGLTTVTIFGSRNEIYTKALAERVTLLVQGIVYLSLNIEENDEKKFSEAIHLIEDFLKEISKEKK